MVGYWMALWFSIWQYWNHCSILIDLDGEHAEAKLMLMWICILLLYIQFPNSQFGTCSFFNELSRIVVTGECPCPWCMINAFHYTAMISSKCRPFLIFHDLSEDFLASFVGNVLLTLHNIWTAAIMGCFRYTINTINVSYLTPLPLELRFVN